MIAAQNKHHITRNLGHLEKWMQKITNGKTVYVHIIHYICWKLIELNNNNSIVIDSTTLISTSCKNLASRLFVVFVVGNERNARISRKTINSEMNTNDVNKNKSKARFKF